MTLASNVDAEHSRIPLCIRFDIIGVSSLHTSSGETTPFNLNAPIRHQVAFSKLPNNRVFDNDARQKPTRSNTYPLVGYRP